MKKIVSILTIVALMIALAACNNEVSVTGVSLDPAAATVSVGNTVTLTATVSPSDADNRAVNWSTSDATVASVENGVVTGVSTGEATITVATVDGNHTANSVITVSPIDVTNVTLSQSFATMVTVGEPITLVATVYPENANPAITWSSSDNAIATVSTIGVLRATGIGEATITATAESGITATMRVVVIPSGNCNTSFIGFTLGTPYFATDQIWTIPGADGRPTQIWSDAVRAPGCDKETFAGGFGADCRRSGNGFDGHFFNWCMVVRFANVLCPYPWRVPTSDDFYDLFLNLGYPALSEQVFAAEVIPNTLMGIIGDGRYPEMRGGVWGGVRFSGNSQFPEFANTSYWSSTETPPGVPGHGTSARTIGISPEYVWPRGNGTIQTGFPIRCIQ